MRINLSHNAAAATEPGKGRAAGTLAIEKARTHSRTAKLLIVAALLCVLTTSVLAQTPSPAAGADAYVQQFESSYHDVRGLRANFTQTYTLGTRPPRVESGQVAFERGGLMRWDYQRPMEKLFVSDGKQVSFYVPEEHQLTRSSLKASEDFRVPFELLLARLNLHKVFARVELADAAQDHEPGDHVLRAFPKKEFADEYNDVLMELSPQFDIRRLVVDYPDHSRMDFRFEHIERNPSLPASLFHFAPPAGTEIIDQH
jgi:chaperone LolA